MLRIRQRTYPLTYNGAAMFAIRDQYGPEALETMQKNTPEGVRCLLGVTMIMAEQGELLRRYYGYRPAEMMEDNVVDGITDPMELLGLRAAVMAQIVEDTRREAQAKDQDVDLGLLELERKKGKGAGKSYYLRAGILAGLDARETMLLPVGTVYDLLDLYVQAHTVDED